jgi:NADPH2:quinone reductase
MRAAHITDLTGPDTIAIAEVAPPVLGPGQILIDVQAAGVTFPDLLMSRGEYQLKPPVPFIPGCEVAGTVREAPADSGWKVGDRVAAFTMLNGYAEQAAANATWAVRLPEAMSFEQGCALPMNYLTMDFALVRRGRISAGETVLIHGAAGGIGTAGIQLAKAHGAKVIAVASTEGKREVALAAGADHAIDVDDFLPTVKELTGGRGVDIVVDPVGGDRFTDSLRSLAPEGRLLVIGFTAGEIPTVKVNRLLLNNIDIVGVAWGSFAFADPAYIGSQWQEIERLLERGVIDPQLGRSYPLASAAVAVGELAQRTATGKVVVLVNH